MKKMMLATIAVLWIGAVSLGDVVVQRWGPAGRVQHPKTLTYESAEGGKLMSFDLSALPPKAKLYRARLVMVRQNPTYDQGFVIVPAVVEKDKVRATGGPLKLVAPLYRWFDATGAVGRAAAAGESHARFLIQKAPRYHPDRTFLEIAYEGKLKSPARQVAGVRALYSSGQVFITFKEIEDPANGKPQCTWGELSKYFRDISFEGPIPKDDKRELRYRVYAHDKPITGGNIGEAQFLAEVATGSGYNTRLVPSGDFRHMRPKAVALRLAVEAEKPLPAGLGLHVHTVRRHGPRYYAVVTCVNGVENTVDISDANSVGPVEQRPASPEPVLQNVNVTKLRRGHYHEKWYSYWAAPPLAPYPQRYDAAVGFCPELVARPARLEVTRGHTWGNGPEMPRPHETRQVILSHSADVTNGLWTGVNDARYTLRGFEEAKWQPFVQRRQEALIRWVQANWEIDPQRIVSGIGAWGMWEIRRPELYAMIHGWGMPELTKGFQCWNWACGTWGHPRLYRGRPDKENPYVLNDYSRYVSADTVRELPYFEIHMGWGAHFSEMGWPSFPRFLRAMIESKRAFCFNSRAVGRAMQRGVIDIRRDDSLPAFGNCSLDDNVGDGDPGCGETFGAGQINGYLIWESRTTIDEPGMWAVTVWLDGTAPLPECTVDLTPRRCRKFKAKPGEALRWTNVTVADSKEAQSVSAPADKHGLVTLKQVKVTKGRHRIVIRR